MWHAQCSTTLAGRAPSEEASMTSTHSSALAFKQRRFAPRILLAEDDGDLRALLARALREDGMCVTEVADGLALRERLLAAPDDYDLVVSDVDMPSLGGLEALDECNAAGVSVPTVLLTGLSDEHVARTAFRLGAVALLSKPFAITDLCIAVDYLARAPRPARRAA